MQILNTKFHIPQIDEGSIILREKLIESISYKVGKRVILVSAPAGFGKTTFIAQWVCKEKITDNTAWLSLDENDNHLLRFWSYLIKAIHKKVPDACSHILELIRCPSNEPFENIIIRLVNCLEHMHTPVVLILDDFHLITDPEILNSFNFLIDHPVQGLVIVISTRKIPALGLSRLRLTGELQEIQQRDLAFSLE